MPSQVEGDFEIKSREGEPSGLTAPRYHNRMPWWGSWIILAAVIVGIYLLVQTFL